ncbi:MAG TPA: methyltransferase domain-containing protein [Mycobacterium sp.]|nr:methyltransferase domain-containing protein [Mycobacterium sp.]
MPAERAPRQADVTDLPFAGAAFDVVVSQHVQMNVADKGRLYREAHRVLAGNRLAISHIAAGDPGELDYPLPWADRPALGHLVAPGELCAVIESSRFAIEECNDLTETAAATMQTVLASPPGPLGLQAFVPNFAAKAQNLTRALAGGRLRASGASRAIG